MPSNNPWLSPADAGKIIQQAREKQSLTQDKVAEELGVDKSYISKLEGGKHHAGRSKYFPELVRVLGLKADQVARLNPGAVVGEPPSSPSPADSSPLDIPPALANAIERYGDDYEDLLTPKWQRFLARARFRDGKPQTAKDWLEVYRDFARTGYEPDEAN